MKRKAARRQAVGISLFPFLAVLICTMGVIIVMLVIVVRQASHRAREEATRVVAEAAGRDAERTAAADAAAKKLREALEDAEWSNEMLAKNREEKAAELANARQLLAHVEDHLRRLKEQAETLMQQARDIDEGKKLTDEELDAARKELDATKKKIAEAEKEVDALKKKAAEKQKWFALIPYDGPNGTRRRPIYIECSEIGITLQPEGVTLLPDDFNGPLGPGNPLDAALRAKREYMERNGDQGLPYPLLVVRPDGIVAYAVARSALKSWDEEFGYELIDAEKKLAFGKGDPQLTQMLESTVRQARQRQAQRAVAMPRKFQPEDNLQSFRTSDIVNSAPEMAMAARGVGGTSRGGNAAGAFSSGTAAGGSGAGTNRSVGGGTGSGYGGDSLVLGGGGNGGTGTSGGTTGTKPGGGASGFVLHPGGSSANGSPVGGGAGGTGTGTGTGPSGTGNGGAGSNQTGGQQAGAQRGGTSGAAGGANASNTAGGAGVAGGVAGGPNAMGSTSGTSAGANGQAGGSSGSSDGSAGQGSPTLSANLTPSSNHPHRRQSNWGLPNSAGKAVAVTRPIRVAALADRIVLLPDKGDFATSPQNIRVQGEDMTVQELDALVAAVQKQMQGWGIAVQNGYWKPVLSVDVSPNAERRFQELEVGLKNSGFDVQRKVR